MKKKVVFLFLVIMLLPLVYAISITDISNYLSKLSKSNNLNSLVTISCTNECTLGTRECVDPSSYRVCGNYDEDVCYEWGSYGACQQGIEFCDKGICVRQSYTLSVTNKGSDFGNILSNDGLINCGADCTENYPAGSQIKLNAYPYKNSIFSGWSGDCNNINDCDLIINSNKNVLGGFSKNQQCADECSPGTRGCIDDFTYYTCGNYDEDPCYEQGDYGLCDELTQQCEDGFCAEKKTCTNLCTPGERRCDLNGYQLCQDINNDGCYEFSSTVSCNSDETCSNGHCYKINTNIEKCSDNTPYGQCSLNKPFYCDKSSLVNNCLICGCNNNGICKDDGSCISNLIYQTIPENELLKDKILIKEIPKITIVKGNIINLNLNKYLNNKNLIVKFYDNKNSFISNILECKLSNNLLLCLSKDAGSAKITLVAANNVKEKQFYIYVDVIRDNKKDKNTPVADAGPDFDVGANSYFILDSFRSYDLDNDLNEDSYSWHENNILIGRGKNLKLRYSQPKSHLIKLVVTDFSGLTSEDAILVNVVRREKCKNTNARYYPQDTICNDKWPSNEGELIIINSKGYSCNLAEVCDESTDYIIEEAIDCCDGNLIDDENKLPSCNFANRYSGNNAKKCHALYLIKSLGADQIYMQDYFEAEMCCRGVTELCTNKNYLYTSNPKPSTEVNLNDLKCYNTPSNNPPGTWISDSNLKTNNIALNDPPAHVSLEKLSTGTCVDYSFSITTLLRKAGYKDYEVLTVESYNHAYNLVKFPLDRKYTIVDTTGNNEPPVVLGNVPYGYDYCRNIKNCYNDNGRALCPDLSEINGCENVKLGFFKETRFKGLKIIQDIKELSNLFVKEIKE